MLAMKVEIFMQKCCVLSVNRFFYPQPFSRPPKKISSTILATLRYSVLKMSLNLLTVFFNITSRTNIFGSVLFLFVSPKRSEFMHLYIYIYVYVISCLRLFIITFWPKAEENKNTVLIIEKLFKVFVYELTSFEYQTRLFKFHLN